MGKFATVPGFQRVGILLLTILAGAIAGQAQQAPTQAPPAQQPAAQQTDQQSSQEAPAEETETRRRVKPRDYKPWVFTAGGGGSLTNGATMNFARGGGGIAAASVARNANKYLGLRADFQFDNLPLRNSALHLGQASGGNDHAYTAMLSPIINIPVNKEWGGYFGVGGSYLHRSGKLDSSGALPGAACNPFWVWWGACYAGSLRTDGKFLTSSQDEFGENFGGGVTHRIRPNLEIYAEFRYVHGKRNGITTDFRPITLGVRW
jgi:hypothetical protein